MKRLIRAAQRAATGMALSAAAAIPLASLVAATPSFAHEFWIEPDAGASGALGPGEIALRLFVGERFKGEELAWDPGRVEEFRAIDAKAVRDLAGESGASPAAWLTPADAGAQLVTYRSRPSVITLEPNAFAEYLRADGLDSVLEMRRARGEQDRPGRERYTRYCKAIVAVAPERAENAVALWPFGSSPRARDAQLEQRVVGHRLEIVLVESKERRGDERAFRVFYEGAPLSGAVIMAAPKSDPRAGLVRARTDRDGRVLFRLDRPGLWLISLVHMVECTGCPDADWDSSWASLVLSMPPAP